MDLGCATASRWWEGEPGPGPRGGRGPRRGRAKVALVARRAEAVARRTRRRPGRTASRRWPSARPRGADACERAVRRDGGALGRLACWSATRAATGGLRRRPRRRRVAERIRAHVPLTVRLARAAIRTWSSASGGRVVVIGSVSMVAPIPNLAASSGSARGSRASSSCSPSAFAREGVTVNIAAPGYVRTQRITGSRAHR